MDSELEKEYDIHFRKFYDDFYKLQTGLKRFQTCKECSTKKRFSFHEDKIIYSCGPKRGDKKCGPQYTIELPKYVNYSESKQEYQEQINGLLSYSPKNTLQYKLDELSEQLDIHDDLEKQSKIIQSGIDSLKNLNAEYISMNELEQKNNNLKIFLDKRYKNSIEKKKIMRELNEDIPEEEKTVLRKKYAILIRESKEFIPMIQELRKKNKDFIMISGPKIINHRGEKVDFKEVIEHKREEQLIDLIIEKFKENDGILTKIEYNSLIRGNEFRTKWGGLLFKGLQFNPETAPVDRPWKYKQQETHGSIIKTPSSNDPEYIVLTDTWMKLLGIEEPEVIESETFLDQVNILIKFYNEVDSDKTEEEIRKIINDRRPKGTPKGTNIPTKPWLNLCQKLENKYNKNPLQLD